MKHTEGCTYKMQLYSGFEVEKNFDMRLSNWYTYIVLRGQVRPKGIIS